MPHRGHVVHHIEGQRLRVRVKSKRRDQRFFQNVKERFNSIDGVQAHVEPVTGSILVHYSGSMRELLQRAAEVGLSDLLEIETGIPDPIAEEMQALLPSQLRIGLFVTLLLFGAYRMFRA